MSTATNELVLRYQFESYMECLKSSPVGYHLIGEGFTTLPEAKNPKEYTRKYVNYKTEKTDVIGYSPSIAYSCDVITGEPVIEEIMEITDNELVGTDTHRNIVSVNCWKEAERYFLTADTALDNSKTYYTKDGTTYTAVTTPNVANIATYYEKVSGYEAVKRPYAIIPANKGDGTDALIYTGTMKACGDAAYGIFDRSTKTFTAN